jgi:hypothetical protein
MPNEERKSKRKLVINPIEYFLVPSIIMKTFDGVITDISDSGLCLLTTSHLKDRQRIIIQDKSSSSEKVAIVRWSQKYDDMLYKIGLEFSEDQTFMNIKDKRRYKRLTIKNPNIHGKMALAHYIRIIDISLGGLSIETDKELNIGGEYTLHLEHEGKIWPIKGYIVWSILHECGSNNHGRTVPIYRAGIKLTSASNEMREVIEFIDLRQKGGKHKYFSLRLDELDNRRKDREHLKSLLK